MAYTGKKPIDHTDVTQSQFMTVTDDLTINGDTSLVDLAMTGGITFDSRTNALDDYEEGTWTPVVSDAITGGNTATTTTSTGFYTKVGRLVSVNCSIVNITTTGMTAANTVRIQGLPFASLSTAENRGTAPVRADNIDIDSIAYGINSTVSAGDSYLIMSVNRDNTTDVTVKVSNLNSGSCDIFISMNYFTS